MLKKASFDEEMAERSLNDAMHTLSVQQKEYDNAHRYRVDLEDKIVQITLKRRNEEPHTKEGPKDDGMVSMTVSALQAAISLLSVSTLTLMLNIYLGLPVWTMVTTI